MTSLFKNEFSVISLIMPVINEANYLRKCLQCIMDQDYSLELIEINIYK